MKRRPPYEEKKRSPSDYPRKPNPVDLSIFLYVDTVNRGKKIVYFYPHENDNADLNLAEKLKVDNERDFKEQIPGLLSNLIKNFLSATDMFSLINVENFFKFRVDFMTDFFTPSGSSFGYAFEIIIADRVFISRPSSVSVSKKNSEDLSDTSKQNQSQIDQKSNFKRANEPEAANLERSTSMMGLAKRTESSKPAPRAESLEPKQKLSEVIENPDYLTLSSFNFVLVSEDKPSKNVDHLKKLLTFFVKGLEFEEQKNSFMTKSVTDIFKQNDWYVNQVKELEKTKGDEWSRKDSKICDIDTLTRCFLDEIEKISRTRRENIKLFSLMKKLIIENKDLELTQLIKMKSPKTDTKLMEIAEINIKPYQTLIVSRRLCLQSLSQNSSPRFKFFIEKLDPNTSFEQMAKTYQFTPKEIQVYVSHLVYWQNALLINNMNKYTTLMINPNLSFNKFLKMIHEYSEKHKQIDMMNIFKCFENPTPLSTLRKEHNLENQQNIFVNMLQNNILVEKNIYIYFKLNEKDEGGEKLILSKKKNISDRDHFIYQKVKKYSLKNVHINEICWRENISQKEVIALLDSYEDLLGKYYL